MSLIYKKYVDNIDYAWYKSSNILYSECYDKENELKSLKIVFKGGRTYLYENIDVNQYIAFRNAVSQGTAFNDFIPKKKYIRLPDSDENEINEKLQSFMSNEEKEDEDNETCYVLDKNYDTNEIVLYLNNKPLFKGIDGKINIKELFDSIGIFLKINKKEDNAKNS